MHNEYLNSFQPLDTEWKRYDADDCLTEANEGQQKKAEDVPERR
jgi:hypothetical protein